MGRRGDPEVSADRRPAAVSHAAGEVHPQFEPLRPATSGRRTLLFIVGPLTWVAALVVVAIVNRQSDSVLIALIVLAASLVFGLITLVPMRWHRVRDEKGQR